MNGFARILVIWIPIWIVTKVLSELFVQKLGYWLRMCRKIKKCKIARKVRIIMIIAKW